MRRFIFLAILGAAALLLGQLALSVGLHPRLVRPAGLLQGSVALVLGTALFISGMLGLAEAYERVAASFAELVSRKQLPSPEVLELRDESSLQGHNRDFWKAYVKSNLGICLFLGGLLALTVGLNGFGLGLYLTGIGSGALLLGTLSVTMAYRGMRSMRSSVAAVGDAVDVLAAQADIRPAVPEPFEKKRIPGYALFSAPTRRLRRVDRIRRA